MRHPLGRIGTAAFLEITGLSKQTFYRLHRNNPKSQKRFDIRINDGGALTFSEAAAREYATDRAGTVATERSPRADRLRGKPA